MAMFQPLRDTLALIEREDRPLLSCLGIGLIVTALLETAGIGVVFVFFSVIVSPDDFGGIGLIVRLHEWLGEPPLPHFVLLLALAVFVFMVVRAAGLWGTLWLNQVIRKRMLRRVSQQLFRNYLGLPYARHLNTRTSVIINNTTTNAAAAVTNCAIGLVEIIGAAVILSFILIALATVKPLETLITASIVALLAITYWRFMHQRLSQWGAAMIRATEESYRIVSEALRGIKTVKVMRLEPRFDDMLARQIAQQTSLSLKYSLAQQAPRLASELALASIILPLVGLAFLGGSGTRSLVPTLVLFGTAAFRVLPAFIKIVNQVQLFRYSTPALHKVVADYKDMRRTAASRTGTGASTDDDDAALAFRSGLQLDKISYHYTEADRPAIMNISLTIRPGEFVAFAGLSGSGKTTTADILLGLLDPTAGILRIDGEPVNASTALRSGLFAYVPQEPFLTDDTLRRNIALGVANEAVDPHRLERAIHDSALDTVVAALPNGLDTILGEGGTRLSGGERQRLGIARALYLEPRILILDEPTSALDAITESEVSSTLDRLKRQCTIIMIAHRLSIVRGCDKIFLFSSGNLVDHGSFEELQTRNEEFRTMTRLLQLAEPKISDGIPARRLAINIS